MTAALAAGAAILLAMVCVSGYGWVTLPSDARVPIHFGVTYNNFVPKRVGLIIHPAAGMVVFLILALDPGHSPGHTSQGPLPLLLPLIMTVLLIVQVGAIHVARRRSGG